jgi:hypothetical protein
MATKDSRTNKRRTRVEALGPPPTDEQKRRLKALGMVAFECADGRLVVLGGEHCLDALYIRQSEVDDDFESWLANYEREEADASDVVPVVKDAAAAPPVESRLERLRKRAAALDFHLVDRNPDIQHASLFTLYHGSDSVLDADSLDEVSSWLDDRAMGWMTTEAESVLCAVRSASRMIDRALDHGEGMDRSVLSMIDRDIEYGLRVLEHVTELAAEPSNRRAS